MIIPKHVIQSYAVPYEDLVELKTVLKKNERRDWTFYYFDDEMCVDFLKKHYNGEVLKAWKKAKNGAMRADLFRYCVLYILGGFWVDVHTKLFDLSFREDSELVLLSDYGTGHNPCTRFGPSVIGCPARHPLLRFLVSRCVNNLLTMKILNRNTWKITGPIFFTECIRMMYPKIANSVKERKYKIPNVDIITERPEKIKAPHWECFLTNQANSVVIGQNHAVEYRKQRKRDKVKHYSELYEKFK